MEPLCFGSRAGCSPWRRFFALKPQKDYVEAAIETCSLIHTNEGPGDILLFLTGEEEIETACAQLEAEFGVDSGKGSLLVLPLYSALPMQQQRRVFPLAPEGQRKVVVATNIAETSLTIDGIVYVVDPGFFKQTVYNPRTHIESLLVSPISKASAMQRAGRAGRTRPGKCFRLYTKEAFEEELPESTHPEILRSNLSSVVITLKKLGVEDLVHFDFMEPPSPESMMRALEMLHFLGAVDEECELTEIGGHMAEFPVDPHLSRALIASGGRGCLRETLTIIAMLSVPPPFQRPRWAPKAADKAHRVFASGLGDHLSLLGTFCSYQGAEDRKWFCQENFLSERSLKQAESITKQLLGIAQRRSLAKNAAPLEGGMLTQGIRRSLIEGFFMQTAHIDQGGKHYMTLRDQQAVGLHPSSFLQHKPEWVLYNETVVTDRCYMRNVTAIAPEMLIEVCPKWFHPQNCNFSDQAKKSLERALSRVKR